MHMSAQLSGDIPLWGEPAHLVGEHRSYGIVTPERLERVPIVFTHASRLYTGARTVSILDKTIYQDVSQ